VLGAAMLAPLFWPAFGLTLLSLAANAASPSRPERLLWTPVLALMAAAALGVGVL
jgi:heme exporter protein D